MVLLQQTQTIGQSTHNGPAPMLGTHLAQIDTDGDGELSPDEIHAAMSKHHGDVLP